MHAAYESYSLANGLRVVLVPDRTRRLVAVHVAYFVGSQNDPPGKSGLAHLVEHLTFESGPLFHGMAFARELTEAGATGNGETESDTTGYHELLPASQWTVGLQLEAARMADFSVDQPTLDHERTIVQAEWRENHQNRWEEQLVKELRTMENGGGPGSQNMPTGDSTDLATVTLAEVRNFRNTYYRPSNAVLAIVGGFDPTAARAQINALFGGLPKVSAPAREEETAAHYDLGTTWPYAASKRRRNLTTDRAIAPLLRIVFPTVPVKGPNYAALRVLAHILGFGEQSRLQKRLVLTGLAESVSVTMAGPLNQQRFEIDITGRYGSDCLPGLETAVRQEVERIRSTGVTAEELNRAHSAFRLSELDERALPRDTARWIALAVAHGRDPAELNTVYDSYAAVRAADVNRVAISYLMPGTALILTIQYGKPAK